jgi:ornithine cyclodeaminase/alanine dehydrogenase-like protein (mu-crystallin family)
MSPDRSERPGLPGLPDRNDPHATLLLDQSDVIRLLPMSECIEVMAAALLALSRGDAVQPVRSILRIPRGNGLLGVMPAYLDSANITTAATTATAAAVVGLKAITVMPSNQGTALDSHQGAVLLFEAECGRLLAILDASAITATRTAAVSAVATRVLADPQASDLAILGSGVQAAAHLDSIRAVRPIARVRVWSRNPDNARRFAEEASARTGLRVTSAPTAEEAVRDAGIVCTTTATRDPVLRGEWLGPGVHVNAVGACTPATRELDTEAVRRAIVFVDHRPAALVEAGDLLQPMREGAITESHIAAELGDVLAGLHPGRRGPREITLFKSLGLAVEDLAAAARLYANARAAGGGTPVRLGGLRHATS